MNISTQFRNLTEPEKEQFEAYFPKKLDSLSRIFSTHFPDEDTVQLQVKLQKHDKHTAFDFEMKLTLPRAEPFLAQEVKHTITEVVDLALEKMERQVMRHFKK